MCWLGIDLALVLLSNLAELGNLAKISNLAELSNLALKGPALCVMLEPVGRANQSSVPIPQNIGN